MAQIPTVRFDTSRLTHTVLAELESTIQALPEVSERNFDEFYDIALRAVAAGGDLHLFSTGIATVCFDMTKRRAAQICVFVFSRIRVMMDRERQIELGITRARWMSSRAPCMPSPKAPKDNDTRQDAAHKAADGKVYVLRQGLILNGKRTWPGYDDGCRCFSMPLIPGLEE